MVVQEDVGEERTDASSLRGTLVSLIRFAALKDSRPQPQLDKLEDTGIGDPVRHHLQQPLLVNRVKEAANVGFEHPAHALAHDCCMQCIQCHVRVTP